MSGLPSSSTRERSRSPVPCTHRRLAAMLSPLELAVAYAAGLWRQNQRTCFLDDAMYWRNNIGAAMIIERNNLVRACRRRVVQPRTLTLAYVRDLIGDGVPAVSDSDRICAQGLILISPRRSAEIRWSDSRVGLEQYPPENVLSSQKCVSSFI